MSHLFASVNPEAADAIEHPPAPPDVGTMVVFKGRAGFSRMQRTEFPALVLGEHRDGGLSLMVMMEPEDMMLEDRVPFRSHNQDQFYWRYRRPSEAEIEGENHRLNDIAKRLSAIEEHLQGEDAVVEEVEQLGARLKVVESVLASDEIEQMEKRIEKLEKVGAQPNGKKGK